jgi:hypothetical protein
MYVIRLTDPQYPGSGIYCVKDCIPPFGKQEFFSEDAVFETTEAAQDHIEAMLSSGWYRTDITRDNFEIVEVKRYNDLAFGFFYYTDAGYKQFKDLSASSSIVTKSLYLD